MTKSRHAAIDAFQSLMETDHYDETRVDQIIARADIARSTFYRHFRNKEAVLIASIDAILRSFTGAASSPSKDAERAGLAHIRELVDHVWERRSMTRVVLRPPTDRTIEAELRRRLAHVMPLEAAWFVAAGVVALLAGWTNGRIAGNPAQIADALNSLVSRHRTHEHG